MVGGAVRSVRFIPPNPYAGWMNYRIATPLLIEENSTHYRIYTQLRGIVPASLTITLTSEHLIMEGNIIKDGQPTQSVGRYVRHLGELPHINPDFVEVSYDDEGYFTLIIPKFSE